MANPDLSSFNQVDPGGTTSGAGAAPANSTNEANSIIPSGAKFYWKMQPPKQGNSGGEIGAVAGFGPAPRLTPAMTSNDPQTGDHMNDTPGPSTHINIRDTHHWTESPTHSRREVPMMTLKELRILTNPMLNQVMNNIGIAVQTGAKFGQDMSDLGGSIKKLLVDGEGKIATSFDDIVASLDESTTKAMSTATKIALTKAESDYANPLNPYSLLYTTTPTKFKYTFPYMEDTYVQKAGGFGDAGAGGLMTDVSSIIAEGLSDISMKKITAPGRMIEQPKGFTFTGREKSYTVKFPLFNTRSFIEIIKNWQFIYLLTYQNTPNRITRDLIDPPCIYEARIPGVWYSKYSSITNMQVDFMGARREMDMPVPFISKASDMPVEGTSESNWMLEKRKISTVIPDAYMVTITITELFSETQNFLYHMIKESMNDKITVTNTQF